MTDSGFTPLKVDGQSVARFMSGGVVAFALISLMTWLLRDSSAPPTPVPVAELTFTSQGAAALAFGFVIDQIRRVHHQEIFADSNAAIFFTISGLAKRAGVDLKPPQAIRIFWKIVDSDKSLETQSTEVRVFGTAVTSCADTTIVAALFMIAAPLIIPRTMIHLAELVCMMTMAFGATLYQLAHSKHLALCAEQLAMIQQHHRDQLEKLAKEANPQA